VLEPKLQNGQKLPKWKQRPRLGQYLGYLDEHSSLVANVRHLGMGYVSPQSHVVFDDLFETVFSSGSDDDLVDSICENLFRTNCEVYAIEEYDAKDNLIYKPPPLDEVWLEMTQVRRYISQMREFKDLTLPLMVKVVAGRNDDVTRSIG
jgi:hypothetical protein